MVMNPFTNLKTIDDFRRADEEFQLKKQAVEQNAKLMQMKQQQMQSGGTLPSAIQIANKLGELRKAQDTQGINDLIMGGKLADRGLVQLDDGSYLPAEGYGAAIGSIGAQKKGMEQQAQKNVDLAMNPLISGADTSAKNQADINSIAPKEFEQKRVSADIGAKETMPIIGNLLQLNEGTIDSPYASAFQPFLKVGGSDKATKLDLMKQARLEAAAPLAKQLGVNPTDKDFQASLDRIFDINATKESRAAQIAALGQRVKGKADIYNQNPRHSAAPSESIIEIPQDQVPPLVRDKGNITATPSPAANRPNMSISPQDPRLAAARAAGYNEQEIQSYLGGR